MDLDVKKISAEILRDLYGSSRRLALYPLGHPITQDTLKKPLNSLNTVFSFKHSFTIELFKERIFAEGILLDDTVYVSGLALDFKKHKLRNAIFNYSISSGDLYHFLNMLISKPSPLENSFRDFLSAKNVTSVVINQENPPALFDFQAKGGSEVEGVFNLKDQTRHLLAQKPKLIADYYMGRINGDDDIFKELKVDFRFGYISNYFRETLLALKPESALRLLEEALLGTNWLDDSPDSKALTGIKRLFDDYLSDKHDETLLTEIYKIFRKLGVPPNIMEQVFDKSSILKINALRDSEDIITALRFSETSKIAPTAMKKTVFKLAASNQRQYLQDLIDQLIRTLSAPSNELRQQALYLAQTSADVLVNGGFFDEFNILCKESVRLALLPSDTIEPVELASALSWLALKKQRWQELRFLTHTLCGVRDDRLQDPSKREAASAKLMEIASSSMLAKALDDILDGSTTDETGHFFDSLSHLGSRELIKTLSSKITDHDINIRSKVIRILTSMRQDAAETLSQLLSEEIAKVENGEISEDQWYYFRNMLRVLKDIGAVESLPLLESMISWPDDRLRLEIIKTLEGMPPEAAIKILVKLVNYGPYEIRRSAIISMGLTANAVSIPYLRDIIFEFPDSRQAAIAALARIGNSEARDILIKIFEDEGLFMAHRIEKKDIEEIRLLILRALAEISDETAIKKLEEYSQKTFSKSLFKRDILSNTAKIILTGKKH